MQLCDDKSQWAGARSVYGTPDLVKKLGTSHQFLRQYALNHLKASSAEGLHMGSTDVVIGCTEDGVR